MRAPSARRRFTWDIQATASAIAAAPPNIAAKTAKPGAMSRHTAKEMAEPRNAAMKRIRITFLSGRSSLADFPETRYARLRDQLPAPAMMSAS